jgi:hypothetical protein
MNAIIAVQDLIKQNQKRIKILQQQLDDHNSGKTKMSSLAMASTENGLEKSKEVLEKNQIILNELMKRDLQELEKEERLKEAIKRKNYFKYQKIRLKRDISKDNDQKLEAMMIVDELPADINLEDDDLFAIAETTIKLDLRIHDELDDELEEIKEDFTKLLKNVSKQDISRLGVLNTHIPVLVLHLSVLISNIKENIKEENLPEFKGLPKFEDWWIEELWSNHQAYFGLYKWKQIIFSLCITSEQKRAWEVIFSNWVFIKKVLNKKRKLGFEYNFAFDTLLKYHTGLEEELEEENLKNMENIIHEITKKEDFLSYKKPHHIITPYLEYKWDKLNMATDKKK